jgi:TPR repeat protein
MSLRNVTADASAERNEYHKLQLDQLEKLDDAEALYQRADRLMWGIGIKMEEGLGYSIMVEAARRGHPVALGRCFLHELAVGKRDNARAIELFRASADRGHASGTCTNSHSIFKLQFSQSFTAQYLLGFCYFHGDGVDQNKQEGIRLYRAAALQGYAPAQYLLGLYCEYQGEHRQLLFGDGIDENRLMATCLFKMAADSGYQLAWNAWKQFAFDEVMPAVL